MGDNRADLTRDIPRLAELHVADRGALWEALGFEVRDGRVQLGAVRVVLGSEGQGITHWAISGIPEDTTDIDGLPTASARTPSPQNSVSHPNGALGIDHVVITTPDFDRTARALDRAGTGLRRARKVASSGSSESFRQGFRRLGPAILELVEAKTMPDGPARFWGLVVIVESLEALAERLQDRLGPIKPAVQPGRRIATLRSAAGLGQPVAFMDPEQ